MSRAALLDDAYAKIDWAGKRLDELKVEVSDFVHREPRPYQLTGDRDANTGDYLIRVRAEPPPPQIALLVSDVLCSLRPSLDYLVFALAILDSGKRQDGTQFPICNTPKNFATKQGWIQALSDPHKATIEGLQPYPGRKDNEWLAVLRDRSNPDKHRHLHVTPSIVDGEFRVLPDFLRGVGRPTVGFAVTGSSHVGFGPPGLAPPILKAQRPQRSRNEMNVHLDLALGITFADSAPVVETLEILQSQVRQLIDAFKPDF